MTKCSQKLWAHKIGAQGAYSTKVESLPPTKAAFRQNVLRAHMQVCIWKSALMPNPPDFNPTDYGWVKNKESKNACNIRQVICLSFLTSYAVPVNPAYLMQSLRL